MLLYGFYRLTVSRDTFFGLSPPYPLAIVYAVALMVPALRSGILGARYPYDGEFLAHVCADTFYPVVVAEGSELPA